MSFPGRRPSVENALGSHEGRIRALEREPPLSAADLVALLQSAEEYVTDGGTTVPFSTTTTLALGHSDGAALLDYTVPTQPEVITGGVYAITASIAVSDAAVTANHYEFSLAVTQALLTGQVFADDVYSSVLNDAIAASLSWTGVFSAGDSFNIRVLNADSVDRGFFAADIAVTRLLAT